MEVGSIIVIGASRGIGKAVVLNMLSAYPNHQLIAVSKKISSQQSEFSLMSSNIQLIDADLSTVSGIYSLVPLIAGPIKFFIYVSGVTGSTYSENPTPEEFDSVMNVNTKGPYFLTKELAPKFQDNSKIMYISSGLARFYGAPYPIYSISKAALNMVWQVMKKELQNVHIACVEPGIVDTDMLNESRRKSPSMGSIRALKPETAGKFIAYLLSERVTGDEYSANLWRIYNKDHIDKWADLSDEGLDAMQ